MKNNLPFVLFLFLLTGCTDSGSKSKTKVPIDLKANNSDRYEFPKFNIAVPENKFIILVSKDQELVTLKNSRIYIPKNSFVDKSGKEVQGKVELVFNEYHSAGEIIASKLPMVFNSPDGTKQNFESAGMFEIRAYQKGQELNLKNGKTIQVDLASESSGAYNFYNLNEKDIAWNLEETDCLPIQNKMKQKLLNEKDSLSNLPKTKPGKPIEMKDGDPVFDINIDYHKYPNLSDLNGVMWKMTEPNDSIKERINNRLFKKKYSFVRLEPLENQDLEFKLFFIQDKDTITFNGAPVMKGKLLSKQQDKFKNLIAKIHENVKLENRLQDQLKRETDLLRSFNVDQLGIYNYDRQFKEPGFIPILANFTFEGMDPSTDLTDVNVYLIPSAKKVVIRYTKETFADFAINPKESNKLIAILPNNEVYYLTNKDIHALNLSQFKGLKREIQLKKYKKVKEVVKLDELIASI